MLLVEKYIISLDNLDLSKILKHWTWLVGHNKNIIALTKLGDALLKDVDDKLYFLDTGNGELNLISKNYRDFLGEQLNEELYKELLLPDLINNLDKNNKGLKSNQVYSFYKIPLIGGEYKVDNIYSADVYEHYDLTGEIHFQIKDLPNGTAVAIKTE